MEKCEWKSSTFPMKTSEYTTKPIGRLGWERDYCCPFFYPLNPLNLYFWLWLMRRMPLATRMECGITFNAASGASLVSTTFFFGDGSLKEWTRWNTLLFKYCWCPAYRYLCYKAVSVVLIWLKQELPTLARVRQTYRQLSNLSRISPFRLVQR